MEGIVIFIIVMVLGSLFKGNKQAEDDGSKTKPFMPQQSQPQQRKQASQTPLKQLRKASEEMMRELQQSMNEEQGQQQQRRSVEQHRTQQPLSSGNPYVKREEEPVAAQVTPQEPVKPTRTIRKKQQEEVKQKVKTTSLLPKDGEDLIRGVIFSEIFGPPKSKR